MSTRSKARQTALQILYQADLNPDVDLDNIRETIAARLRNPELVDFAMTLFSSVMEQRNLLDEKITEVAENWALHRMAPTDRNALRLGAYELLFTDTPPRVVIDEAIEMARLFGTENSSQFVNGILDRLIPDERRDQPRGGPAAD